MNDAIGGLPSDFSDHYPELARHKGLMAAILATAADHGLDLGDGPHAPGPDGAPTVARFDSPRGGMEVVLRPAERGFDISLYSDRGWFSQWADGTTADLAEATRVLAAWKHGETLTGLAQHFPFMTYTRLSQGYDEGNQVTVMWDLQIGDPKFAQYRELLIALRAEPRLAQMFPFFSMWTLRLAKDSLRKQPGQLLIQQKDDGSYLLWSSSETEEKKYEFHRIDDLVAAAATLQNTL
ncbi:hypothetical protein ADK60_29985 [Streptomyces sp. XY431]|uniref:hypothetical protein n=1 Tax=Streptomyces sp. XY431 TaxID=1415562 RepID=UPI0006B06D6A|nr:hypothetical protein [Streptomyces sp. XY431]KOV13326.1 hypothetical protein ADK60_29985 [Streptomyces sp. XY431]